MRKYILYGIILFQIALVVSLIRGIQLSRRSTVRITDMESTKAKLEEENRRLQKENEYVTSPYYLEKVAREELHLAKLGETVVIVPERIEVKSGKEEVKSEILKSNWQKWFDVLSGKI